MKAVDAPHERGAERDRATIAWFGFFRALDATRDPSFDPKDLPVLHVVPPPVHGIRYPAGVDPQAISDLAARATYEAALRANNAKSERFARQYGLQDVDARSTAAFRRYRERAFAPTQDDAADFTRLLSKSGLSAAREKALRL